MCDLVMARSTSGGTVSVVVELLSEVSGSGVCDVTDAVLATEGYAPGSTVATSVMSAGALARGQRAGRARR